MQRWHEYSYCSAQKVVVLVPAYVAGACHHKETSKNMRVLLAPRNPAVSRHHCRDRWGRSRGTSTCVRRVHKWLSHQAALVLVLLHVGPQAPGVVRLASPLSARQAHALHALESEGHLPRREFVPAFATMQPFTAVALGFAAAEVTMYVAVIGPSARRRCRSSSASLVYTSRGRRSRAPRRRASSSDAITSQCFAVRAGQCVAVRAGSTPLADVGVRTWRALRHPKRFRARLATYSSASSVARHTLCRLRSGPTRRPGGRKGAPGERGPALAPARGSDGVSPCQLAVKSPARETMPSTC